MRHQIVALLTPAVGVALHPNETECHGNYSPSCPAVDG